MQTLRALNTLRTSLNIFILAYCLVALGELSSVYKIKSDFSLNSELVDQSGKSEQSGPSDHSDHSGRSGLPAQFDYSGPFEYPQQTRNDSLEPEFFSSIQRTINSHNETVPMDLSCFDCDVRQLAPYSTQRSPKNDFFFC